MLEVLQYQDTENWNIFYWLIGGAYLLALTVDTLVLYLAKWKPFNESFADAFLINTASGGAILILFMGGVVRDMSTALFYTTFCLIFILVEGLVLSPRKGENSRGKTWGLVVLMNAITYGLLALAIMLLP